MQVISAPRAIVGLTRLVDRDHVGMVDSAYRGSFVSKAHEEFRIIEQVAEQDLQGHWPVAYRDLFG